MTHQAAPTPLSPPGADAPAGAPAGATDADPTLSPVEAVRTDPARARH
ncbi:MAG: hypothetical protein JWP82_2060, partial [Humibacillus sp.]|nr:hypothetical protein [Humibacillus sp.]